MIKHIEYIRYNGKGNHSVNELEAIIEQRETELSLIKSRDVVKNNVDLDNVICCADCKSKDAYYSKVIKKYYCAVCYYKRYA